MEKSVCIGVRIFCLDTGAKALRNATAQNNASEKTMDTLAASPLQGGNVPTTLRAEFGGNADYELRDTDYHYS